MSLVCTFAVTCDCCGRLIRHRSEAVPMGTGAVVIPDRNSLMNMDLCGECQETAVEAASAALAPIQAQASARRTS